MLEEYYEYDDDNGDDIDEYDNENDQNTCKTNTMGLYSKYTPCWRNHLFKKGPKHPGRGEPPPLTGNAHLKSLMDVVPPPPQYIPILEQ